MGQFYVSIIFVGIILVIAALLWVVFDRKKTFDYVKSLDAKKEELIGIIRDAEQMIEELNKFSDYIVSQMDLKNEELWNNLKLFEEQAKRLVSESADSVANARQHEIINKKAVNDDSSNADANDSSKGGKFEYRSDLIIEDLEFTVREPLYTQVSNLEKAIKIKEKEKVIPFNAKYRDVINLADEGLSSTEIAKKLNMGKGEIQLVLELNK